MTARAVHAAPEPGAVEATLRRLLPLWLPRQRWYADKGRAVALRELAVTVLECGVPAMLHVLVRTGSTEWYQLLLGAAAEPPPGLDHALLAAEPDREDGLCLYEAAADPRLMDRLLRLLAVRRDTGTVRFRHPEGAAIPLGLPEHASTAGQSNTSLVFGDRLMLKRCAARYPASVPNSNCRGPCSAPGMCAARPRSAGSRPPPGRWGRARRWASCSSSCRPARTAAGVGVAASAAWTSVSSSKARSSGSAGSSPYSGGRPPR